MHSQIEMKRSRLVQQEMTQSFRVQRPRTGISAADLLGSFEQEERMKEIEISNAIDAEIERRRLSTTALGNNVSDSWFKMHLTHLTLPLM